MELRVILVGKGIGGDGAVVRGVGEIGAAVLDEFGKQIRLRTIENPAGAGEAVGEHAALAVANVDVRLGVAGVVFELEGTPVVLGADIAAAETIEEVIRACHRDVDRRGGDGAHGGDAVGVAGLDAGSGVGGRADGGIEDDLTGEGADVVLAAENFRVIDVAREERELRRGAEAVVDLGRDVFLAAVIIDVAGAVIPEVIGLRSGVLEIALRGEPAECGLGVEEADVDAEVAAAAKRVEHFLVAEVGEGVDALLLAEGNLLGERRRDAGGERVGDAAFFAHGERRAALEIDGAAEGIGALVGRVALDELDLIEHRAGDVVHENRAAGAALAGEHGAIHRDGIEAGGHAADGEAGEISAGVEFAVDAGEADGDFAGVHVGEIAERVGGGDVLEVFGVACGGDGGGAALPLAGDFEGVEFVDARGEIEVADGGLIGGDGDGGARGVEAGVGDDEFVGAGGDCRQEVAAGVVDEGGDAERGNFDAGALQEVAGGEIGDVAGDRGGEGGGGEEEGEGEKERGGEGERK